MYLAALLLLKVLVSPAPAHAQGGSKQRTRPLPSSAQLIENDDGMFTAHLQCDFGTLFTPLATPSITTPTAFGSDTSLKTFNDTRWNFVTRIVMSGCSPVESSDLVQVLKAGGVWNKKIVWLELLDVPDAIFNDHHFKGIWNIKLLKIQAVSSGTVQFRAPHIWLRNLEKLYLANVALSLLPWFTTLKFLELRDGRSLGKLGGCCSLNELVLRDWRVPANMVEQWWPQGCFDLTTLRAERMERDSLRTVMKGTSELLTLELRDNELTMPELGTALQYSSKKLTRLDVSRNNLSDIDDVLDLQSELQYLSLAHNMVSSLDQTLHSLSRLPSLVNLTLDHNPLRDHCLEEVLPRLQLLSLVSTNASRLCYADWASLVVLNLTDNSIEELQFAQLPLKGRSVLSVDLRRNPLREAHLSESDYRALKDAAKATVKRQDVMRQVKVLTEPLELDCECRHWWLATALRESMVLMPQEVRCRGNGALQDAEQDLLCGSDRWAMWTGGVSAMLLLVALWVIYVRYNNLLKVSLYARGWCLCCVREELEMDREYDVFLSFAYGDYEFVASQLLPGLEDGPRGYRVCVHYRDWVVGELITTQISRSIEASRRTVIVLSAHFVRSAWGLVEFRAAHMSALAEGRVRLLVVVLEDTPPAEDLPEELQLYLRTTTYLHWGDPWFWDKFRYALPHRTVRGHPDTELLFTRQRNVPTAVTHTAT